MGREVESGIERVSSGTEEVGRDRGRVLGMFPIFVSGR